VYTVTEKSIIKATSAYTLTSILAAPTSEVTVYVSHTYLPRPKSLLLTLIISRHPQLLQTQSKKLPSSPSQMSRQSLSKLLTMPTQRSLSTPPSWERHRPSQSCRLAPKLKPPLHQSSLARLLFRSRQMLLLRINRWRLFSLGP
jgi:hypothetical protein